MGSTAQLIDVENYALAEVKDVLDLLECPICCEERLFPPVFQCKNGHAICSSCKNTVGMSCPTCRSSLIGIRSLPFEKLFDALRFTCKFYKFGCLESFPYNAKLQHEQKCGFMPFDCPYPRSNCIASSFQLHSLCGCQGTRYPYEKLPRMRGYGSPNRICSHQDEYFCLYIKSTLEHGSASFITHLMFMGGRARAEEFRYHVQVSSRNRKKSHEGVPFSIRNGHDTVEACEDGLVINSKAAQLLSADGSGNFKISVTVKI